MLKDQILTLQKDRIYPSITILLPTTRITVDAAKEKLLLKNLINELEEKLKSKVDKKEAENLLNKVNVVIEEIDFFRLSEGLGIFVNEERGFYIKFPFSVPALTVVDDTFLTKFLIKQYNRSLEYFLLNLNEGETNLFYGFNKILEPIESEDFPFSIKDVVELEYEQGTWGFESAQIERLRQYVRESYKRFKKNTPEGSNLIISGVNKINSLFEEVNNCKGLIGKIEGSYNIQDLITLGKKAHEIITKYLSEQREKLFKEFVESFGYKKGAYGLLDVWNLASQGRVETLLVEENYCQPARFEGNQPVFVEEVNDTYVVEDLVDETIELVFTQKGKVYFYEDGKLKDYQRIGAILRY